MAAIEQGSGADETVVRAFLARALSASRGEQWVCTACAHAHTEWMPTCANCKGFDTLEWKEPPTSENDVPMDAVMPLIMGKPAETPKEPDVPSDNPIEFIDADPLDDEQT